MKRVVFLILGLVVVAALVAVNVSRSKGKAVEVEVAAIERKDLTETVSGSGRIEARKSVSITSSVVGKVIELNAEEGDAVEAGEVILRIDPGERKAMLEQARATLAREEASEQLAGAELRRAQFELRRVNGLVTGGLASDQEMESAQTNHDVAQARAREAAQRVRSASAGVEQARYELDKTVIRAEIDGIIVRLAVEEGENVLAGDLYNAGSSIVEIADLSAMEAQILVDETEVVKLARGQAAEIEVDAFPDEKLAGQVVEVGNSAYNAGPLGSQEAKDFRVRILLTGPPATLRPGLSARAEVVTQERGGVLAVPIEALTIRDPEEEARKAEGQRTRRSRRGSDGDTREVEGVFVVREGEAMFVPVETGIAGEKDFELTSGLAEGDRIVKGPFEAVRNLESGEKVKEKNSPRSRRGRGDDDEGDEEADHSEDA